MSKRNLELIIEGQKVDLFKDESVSITDTLNNISDISKVFAPFSKTFNLPASSTNNTIFKHYYNYEIDNGYDARFRKSAILTLDGVDFRKGSIQLNGTELRDNKIYSYKVTFFGATTDLKEILGDADLSSLWILHDYKFLSTTDILDMFEIGLEVSGTPAVSLATANLIIPFITLENYYSWDPTNTITTPNFHSVSWTDLKTELKPAIKAKLVIEAINDVYGLDIQTADIGTKTAFFGSDVFDELYIWLHRTKSPITVPNTPVADEEFGMPLQHTSYWWSLDDFVYTGGAPDFLNVDGTITIPEGEYRSIRITFKTAFGSGPVTITARDRTTGEILWYKSEVVIDTLGTTFTLRDLTSGTLSSRTYNVEVQILNKTSQAFNMAASVGAINDASGLANYSYGAFNLDYYITPESMLPKMKIIDFLSGLFKMFNLVAYTENDSDTIFVQTFDDFMTGGTNRDITKYVNMSKSSVSRPIPFRTVEFQFETPNTQMGKRYLNEFSRSFGDLDYSSPDRYEGKQFSLKLPFSHQPLINLLDQSNTPPTTTGLVQGWSVDEQGKTQVGKPYLFFRRYMDVSGIGGVLSSSINSYIAPANISTDGNHSTSFGNEEDEFLLSLNENGLFNRFYSQYITQTFEEKGRIISVEAYLPVNFILNYQLNDVIIIGQGQYYINSIRTNLTTGKSKLELLVKTKEYTASVLT